MKHIILISLFFTAFYLCSHPLRAQTSRVEIALSFLAKLDSAKYQEALDLSSDQFKSKVTPEAMQTLWGQLNGQYGRYESAEVSKNESQAEKLIINATFEKYIVPFTFNFNSNQQISGFLLQQSPKVRGVDSKFPEEPISIRVEGGIISGSLMTPEKESSHRAVALIIAGSGPTDRNGNSAYGLYANSYKLLAEALAGEGIASFRYDKRMVGESTNFNADEKDLVFHDFVDDAMLLSSFLIDQRKFSKLYIIGHSEGSNIGMIAAQQVKPTAFISISGPGENLASIIKTQLINQPELAEQAEPIIEKLIQGKTEPKVPEALNALFAPSIQPFIITSFRVDPLAEIKKLDIPVLIIGGTTDLQVPAAHAEALKKANPKATLLLIKSMNHVMKHAPEATQENLATYNNPNLPLHQDLVMGLVNYIQLKNSIF